MGWGWSQKKVFRPFGPHIALKKKGGPGPQGPFPGPATGVKFKTQQQQQQQLTTKLGPNTLEVRIK